MKKVEGVGVDSYQHFIDNKWMKAKVFISFSFTVQRVIERNCESSRIITSSSILPAPQHHYYHYQSCYINLRRPEHYPLHGLHGFTRSLVLLYPFLILYCLFLLTRLSPSTLPSKHLLIFLFVLIRIPSSYHSSSG